MSDYNTQSQMPPQPDPALKRLEKLVGSWTIKGRIVGAEEDNIAGKTTFEWLPGGFFLQQRITMNLADLEIESLELIGYDAETKAFSSFVYSNFSPAPLPYKWDL